MPIEVAYVYDTKSENVGSHDPWRHGDGQPDIGSEVLYLPSNQDILGG